MIAQCFLDLRPMTACSTIALPADASPDHVARLGRNLEFASLGVADKHSVVLAYRPEGRFAFVSIGWPGMIGVLSGINEHGLCIANMEVTRGMRMPRAMPYSLLYRSVLEQCRSVDEAVAFLERTPRQTANNVMLMDEKGVRAVVEITPERVVVRRGASGAALESTNHQRGKDQDRHGLCRRYECLHDGAAADFGKIDVARLRVLLGRASLGNMTMQSMIFEPATRTIYLATGKDASHRDFEKIDLRPYLQ
jgi:predicted choloylglycine hydrolase